MTSSAVTRVHTEPLRGPDERPAVLPSVPLKLAPGACVASLLGPELFLEVHCEAPTLSSGVDSILSSQVGGHPETPHPPVSSHHHLTHGTLIDVCTLMPFVPWAGRGLWVTGDSDTGGVLAGASSVNTRRMPREVLHSSPPEGPGPERRAAVLLLPGSAARG